jgi:predicted dithiol-disulfide oxidoreductase (DUF899 family)
MAADDDLTINHPVVSHEEWLKARLALLDKEKAFTRQTEEMSRLQRSLPWERVTKDTSGDSDFNFDYHVSFTPEEMGAVRSGSGGTTSTADRRSV